MDFFGTILQEIKILLIPLLIVLLFKDFIISVVMKKITILSFLKREVKIDGINLMIVIFGAWIMIMYIM